MEKTFNGLAVAAMTLLASHVSAAMPPSARIVVEIADLTTAQGFLFRPSVQSSDGTPILFNAFAFTDFAVSPTGDRWAAQLLGAMRAVFSRAPLLVTGSGATIEGMRTVVSAGTAWPDGGVFTFDGGTGSAAIGPDGALAFSATRPGSGSIGQIDSMVWNPTTDSLSELRRRGQDVDGKAGTPALQDTRPIAYGVDSVVSYSAHYRNHANQARYAIVVNGAPQ